VLVARPSDAEAQLAYAAAIDLLDGVDAEELATLSGPQRRALEVATLRAEADGGQPDPGATAVEVLSVLRALSAREPLVVAVDDVQWLDPPSADALTFAARRLEDHDVRFLLAKRPGEILPLERARERQGLDVLEIGPLSLGAVRHLLSERLGLTVARHVLRRLVELTHGNPLFALELGRSVPEGHAALGDDLPVPETVEDLLGTRVERLPPAARTALLAVALQADLRVSELTAILDPVASAEALGAGVVIVDGERVRPSHPLLAAAAKSRAAGPERREMHRALAHVVADAELRALHLALAAEPPDEALSATVAEAAARATARGAAQQAVALSEHALRLTALDSPARTARLLALAQHLAVAGTDEDGLRIKALLEPELESLPSGAARVRAHLLLADGLVQDNGEIERHLHGALVESGSEAALRADGLGRMSENMTLIRVERIREAEAWAQEAVHTLGFEGQPLHALSWAVALQGRDVAYLCEGRAAASTGALRVLLSPERAVGRRLAWRGEVVQAREILSRLLSLADERGEAYSYALFRHHLCQLELRIGDCAAAGRLLEEWAESSDPLMWPMYERSRALFAAACGSPSEAELWAGKTIAQAERTGARWDWLEAQRAIGTSALLRREPERAAESLRAVWAHTEREGVDEPGVFPVAPELVEVLVELGALDEARAVSSRLRGLSEAQGHPWGLVSARRCDALIRLAEPTGLDEGAATALAEAADAYGGLGLRADRARTLLALGRTTRRRKKWLAARTALEQAAEAFDELGSPGWADAARSELARVGGRKRRADGELTEAEHRVVELAAGGSSNKEIAQAMVVTVATVETHLSRAYAKLGVRSRTQLAARLSPPQ
jgi:DNA-binding CsgD family transcriptional regulator